MARKQALIKLTGDLAELRQDVIEFLRSLVEQNFFLVVCVGGGTRITKVFEEKGYQFNFGPLGREVDSFEGRQLARDILEFQQCAVQDALAAEGIHAAVVIPALDIGTVLCPLNGDTMVMAAYLGFDRLYVLTLHERVAQKVEQFRQYPKVEVVGFPAEVDKDKFTGVVYPPSYPSRN